jgi:hypothetical protein
LIVTSCGWGVIGGTSVGSGASLIVTAGTAAACSGTGAVTGLGSLALINAQPPSVAANEAAVMNILTPGALVLGFLADLVMVITVIIVVIMIVA